MAVGFDIGALLGSIVSATGLGIGRSGMHPVQGSDIGIAARELGVSPLAMLGGAGGLSSGSGASVGDPGVAGQMLGRAFTASKPAEERLAALRETNLALENARLQNDVVAGQMRNSIHRQSLAVGTPPPRPTFGPDWPSGMERPKAMIQPFYDPEGRVVYGPTAAVQQSLWSPLPGLPANPAVIASVSRANAGMMPPDVARMSGMPPGAYPFIPGTAPSLWSRWFGD